MSKLNVDINSKYNGAGVKQAQEGLASLGGAIKTTGDIMKGLIALKAVQELASFVSSSIDAYKVQQQAISQLTVAIGNNANLTSASLQRLIKYTGELQSKSIYGDELLQGQATLLAAMGLTEEQIKKTLDAAVELSSAGVGTLEGNVKNLAKTFGGLTGELGESIPALKTLTKEQLEHGDAIDYVKQRYNGFAQNLATGTLSGQLAQLSNNFGDLKEQIGAAFAPVASPFITFIDSIISKWTTAIAKANELNDAIRAGMGGTATIEQKQLLLDTNRAKFMGDYSKDVKKGLAGSGITLTDEQSNKIVEAILRQRVSGDSSVIPSTASKSMYGIDSYLYESIKKTIFSSIDKKNNSSGDLSTSGTKVEDDYIIDALKSFDATAKEIRELREKDKSGAGLSGSGIGSASPASGMNLDLWKTDLTGVKFNILGDNVLDFSGSGASAPSSGGTDLGFNFNPFAGMGQMGDVITKVVGGLDSFIGSIGSTIMSFSSITAIMSPMQIILKSFAQTLAPLVDQLLAPIIGALSIIGISLAKILVPVLKLLEPVITAVSFAFIGLYNYAILPFANALIWLVVQLNNTIARGVNAILKFIDAIPGVSLSYRMGTLNYDEYKLETIGAGDLTSAGNEYTNSSSSSSSASYSGAKDVTVNIYFSNSYVNGDAREIALNLRNEIQLAEALGL